MALLGLHLTLLLGPTVAVPAPPTVIEHLQSVEVTHSDEGRSGFQIVFGSGRSGPAGLLDHPLLTLPLLRPFNRVILIVTFNAVPRVLMDGIITDQQLLPSNEPGGSRLAVTGEDVSLMMDLEERSAEHPAQDETVIALKLIATYAQYGLIPTVLPPPVIDPPLPIERIPVQQGTDLAYLTQMARRHAYVFYVSPGPAPFANVAYWGPPTRLDLPQRALSVNMGPDTNVENLRFRHNVLAPAFVSGEVQDRLTNQVVPVQTVASLRPPLSSQPSWLVHFPNLRRTQLRQSGLTAVQAFARAQATADASTDAVVAEGELDALQLQRPPPGPRAGRSAGGRLQLRRPLLRQAGDPQHHPPAVPPALHPDPRRGRLDRPGGDPVTPPQAPRFFGKYRGKVENNVDVLFMGRIQVSVPAVLGPGRLSWALPCAPGAGSGAGLFLIPPQGANVWVEFEAGDPDYPIYCGGFWGPGEAPASPAVPQMAVLKTESVSLTINNLPGVGGFTLEVSPPAVPAPMKLVCDANGIELSHGPSSVKLTLSGVNVNNGALK